ncbi:acetate--CoA ligase family protein [Pseudidiomarina insulisalsae]|uniref:Cyanophycin synthetase n=1 Tax=Pseudidiomarina insulisalsae TaxID=575789 RepID=A0A432YLI2_9GAMM|nr:acetate--CoA ligase family protein [Pseudidiomarina insulisalsae]RUO61806.1 cyanophycin synthetase [Pseudidiomarina insulisalsae]
MTSKNKAQSLGIVSQKYIPGYWKGRRQPSLVLGLRGSPTLASQLSQPQTGAQLRAFFDGFGVLAKVDEVTIDPSHTPVASWEQLVRQIALTATHILEYLKYPLLDAPAVVFGARSLSSTVVQAVPHCNPVICTQAYKIVIDFLNQALFSNHYTIRQSQLLEVLEQVRSSQKQSLSPLFLKAAVELNIPVIPLNGAITQFGFGANSHWFEHTFSLDSANISVRLARDKLVTNLRLRQAGVPVPENSFVESADEALQFAEKVGFPVVIKPSNRDGGKAVTANLTNANEVRAAFAKAAEASERVMVEQHVAGRDYRVTVVDGKAVWAVERVPGGVFGDGQLNVARLIEQENLTLHRRVGPRQTLKPLRLDDEARHILAKQGLNAESVPERGQFVRLSSIANVATGGRPVPVFDRLHPDNAALAERAARALRLDIAGIDLLIDDISRSWREVGANICEVNAQPDLGATTALHLYRDVLQARLPLNPRIPVVVVVGEDSLAELVDSCRKVPGLGWITSEGMGIGADVLADASGAQSAFTACQALLTDPAVTSLLLHVRDGDISKNGLAFDNIDLLVFTERLLPQHLHLELCKTLLPVCRQQLAIVSNSAKPIERPRALLPDACQFRQIAATDLHDLALSYLA